MENKSIITGSRKAISNLFIRHKVFINHVDRTYTLQQTVLGLFKTETQHRLPKPDYVLVFQSYFQPSCEACAMDEDERRFYQVSLVYNSNRRVIVHETKSTINALELGRQLAEQLNLKLKDVTVRGKVTWVNCSVNYGA
jgi:hypothetical protein